MSGHENTEESKSYIERMQAEAPENVRKLGMANLIDPQTGINRVLERQKEINNFRGSLESIVETGFEGTTTSDSKIADKVLHALTKKTYREELGIELGEEGLVGDDGKVTKTVADLATEYLAGAQLTKTAFYEQLARVVDIDDIGSLQQGQPGYGIKVFLDYLARKANHKEQEANRHRNEIILAKDYAAKEVAEAGNKYIFTNPGDRKFDPNHTRVEDFLERVDAATSANMQNYAANRPELPYLEKSKVDPGPDKLH